MDDALATLGLHRRVVAVVPRFPAAIAIASASDLVALVPARQTAPFRAGTWSFPLPVATGPVTVSQMWHPRLDADPGHRWLRSLLRAVCRDDVK